MGGKGVSDTDMENKIEPGFGGVSLCMLQGNQERERPDSPWTQTMAVMVGERLG